MSTVMVIAPVISAAWPLLAAAITAVARSKVCATASRGDQATLSSQASGCTRSRATIDVDETQILEHADGTGEALELMHNGVRALFSRNPRGILQVCLEGTGQSPAELRRIGEELIGRVRQQYVYHRIVAEMKSRKMPIVEEEMAADQSVRIRIRSL